MYLKAMNVVALQLHTDLLSCIQIPHARVCGDAGRCIRGDNSFEPAYFRDAVGTCSECTDTTFTWILFFVIVGPSSPTRRCIPLVPRVLWSLSAVQKSGLNKYTRFRRNTTHLHVVKSSRIWINVLFSFDAVFHSPRSSVGHA